MCELKRRDLLLGASAMLLYGCGDAEKYNQGKDYYPVANLGNIFHWGKNSAYFDNLRVYNSNATTLQMINTDKSPKFSYPNF